MKYKEGSVLIKDIQRRFSQGLEVYSIMTATVSTMTATFFNYPKKVATLNWNGRQPCFGMAGNHGVEYAPYSSGQCFFYCDGVLKVILDALSFQSLIHQVSVSFPEGRLRRRYDNCNVSIPYSSGQCFFWGERWTSLRSTNFVSIPYSSGQCFFYEQGNLKCQFFQEKFQSLIHQVSVSFIWGIETQNRRRGKVSIPYSSGQCFFCPSIPPAWDGMDRFQSLIHQVSVSFVWDGGGFVPICNEVSIPYSSGQCFFYDQSSERKIKW